VADPPADPHGPGCSRAWLIRRFIDPGAEFVFVPGEAALDQAREMNATSFVIPGAELARRGTHITMEVMLEKYQLGDPALALMAQMVRAADVRQLMATVPEAAGLAAVLHGFFLLNEPGPVTLELELRVFDALYAYAREQVTRASSSPGGEARAD
jgi:hypothetical protein